MLRLVLVLSLLFLSAASFAKCEAPLDFEGRKLHSNENLNFCEAFSGKVLLVVNTASNCGFTPQFEGLEALYEKYKDKNFAIVGFPSNDFNQEHSEEEKTADICYINYGVTFNMMSTSSVKGDTANPVFKDLIAKTGKQPSWNFNKYLVSVDGSEVKHYDSKMAPLDSELEKDIATLLANK